MAAEHLHALRERLVPGRSVRRLCEDAGVVHSTVARYFHPDYRPENMPPVPAMLAIAKALSCELVEVSRAFASDVGLGLAQEMLTDAERALLERWRGLGGRDQRVVAALIDHLSSSPEG